MCVCVCVCVWGGGGGGGGGGGVDAYSATTGYEVANEQYQLLQNYANLEIY